MKNLFSYSVKPSDGNARLDSEEFVVGRIDGELAARRNRLSEDAAKMQKAASFPIWFSFIKMIVFIAAAALLMGGLRAIMDGESSLEEMGRRGLWWILGAGGVGILIFVAMALLERKRKKDVLSAPAFSALSEETERVMRDSLSALHVPETAVRVDILTFPYKMRFGKPASVGPAPYANVPAYAYRDGDALYLTDAEIVIRIPHDRIEGVSRVCRWVWFSGWNKQLPPNREPYKQYKIRINAQLGTFGVKPYYAVRIRGNEPLVFLFPAYEFEAFAAILGAKALSAADVKKLD